MLGKLDSVDGAAEQCQNLVACGTVEVAMKVLTALIIVLVGSASSLAQSGPTVTVTGGQVRGAMLERGGAVFKGIPYAQPPVGELRWREPVPVKPWSGIRSATEFGPMCAQKPSVIMPNAAEITREDCLFVNVWTAEWPSRSPKPVMVWIPGGGNFAGGSSESAFDGERLARRGVVLVSLNYRLGALGFFSHPALTRESSRRASGNQGILDQIAALEWVRDNIARFGGDPNNVTIFGNSAGSLNVSVLLTSPLSKGLFHRAIGQSGAVVLVGDPLTLPEAEKRGEAAVARWKVPASASLAELRAIPTTQIFEGEPDLVTGGDIIYTVFPNLGITVDGHVFTRKPAEVFAAGQQHPVPLLHGSTARERIPGSRLPADLKKAIADTYGPLAQQAELLYVGTDPMYGTERAQWATDTSFRCASVAQVLWHAKAGHTAYEYEFARVAAGREALGATHAAELSHVFGTLDRGVFGVGPPATATEVDVRVSEVMQQYWTNFAKTGNPNGSGVPEWPRFDPAARAYIQFTDGGPVAKEGLRRPYCDLFIENVGRSMAK